MIRAHHRFYLAAFFCDFALSCAYTAIPFVVYDQFGGDARTSGTIGGVQSLFYALACLASAQMLAVIRNGIRIAVIGSLGFGLITPVAVLAPSVFGFGVLVVVGWLFMALFWPAMQAWVGGEPDPALRTKRIAAFNLSWTVGLGAAPLVAGPLYEVDYRLPFALASAACLVTMAIVATLPHDRAYFGTADAELRASRFRYDTASEAHLHCAWFASLCGWAMIGVTRAVFPKRIHELVETGSLVWFANAGDELLNVGAATAFSWLIGIMYIARAVATWAMGRSIAWQHRFGVLLAVQAAATAGLYLLGRTSSLAVMAVCVGAIGVSSALTFFASLSYSVANPERKHHRAAIHESMVGLGSFIGAILFGELAGRFNTEWPFLYAPVIMLAALVVQYLLLHLGRRRIEKTA